MGRGGRRIAELALMSSPMGMEYLMAKEAARGVKRGRGLYVGSGLYTGAGEYVPAGNDLIVDGPAGAPSAGPSGSSKSSQHIVPVFSKESDNGVIISRREYVSEIYAPAANVAFQLQSFPINPGLEGTFPWLSQLACNYDEFEMLQLIFTFKSTTTESNNSSNGQVGTVIMATNYNAAAPSFTDKVTMMQYAFANSGRLTESLIHGVECDPEKLSGSPGSYIRNNPVVSGQDLKTYDHGKFQIAVANCASAYANTSIGELWVSYTIRLRKPKFYSALGLNISKDIFVSNGNESPSGLFGQSTAQTFATALTPSTLLFGQQNNIGCKLATYTTGATNCSIVLTFPAAYKGNVRVSIAIGRPCISAVTQSSFTTAVWSDFSVGAVSGQLFKTYGNVAPIADLYGSAGYNEQLFDAPVPSIASGDGPTLAGQIYFGQCLIAHLAVNIATGNTNNQVEFVLTSALTGAAVIPQTYLEVAEYNAGFSYASTGLGASSAPVFVNAGGVVTIPAAGF